MVKSIGQIFKIAVRKRIFWLGLILLAISLWGGLALLKKPPQPQLASLEKTKNPLLEDPDRDGLQNWEEQLYGTDLHNQDTDGDGTNDGEEVKAGRNPLVKGLTDKISEPTKAENKIKETEPVNFTQLLLDDFTRSGGIPALFSKGGAPLASNLISQKIDDLVRANKISPAPLPAAAAGGLKIGDNIGEAAVKKYLNSLASIFIKNISSLKVDDLDLFLSILRSGELERLSELAAYKEAALKSAAGARALVAPKNLAWFHQKEIFYLEEAAGQLGALENAARDPVGALAVIQPRVDLKIDFIKLHYGELRVWLSANKIVVNPKEKAYYLIH